MTLDAALERIATATAGLTGAGGLASVDVQPHDDDAGCLMAMVEFQSGHLLGASFSDDVEWTADRRDELESLFGSTAAIAGALVECQTPGGPC